MGDEVLVRDAQLLRRVHLIVFVIDVDHPDVAAGALREPFNVTGVAESAVRVCRLRPVPDALPRYDALAASTVPAREEPQPDVDGSGR